MTDQQSLKEKTAKGLFWGGLSNGIQQLLILFFGIFISRILNAEDYGMVGMLTIFSAIAGIIQDSGFTVALINKKDVTHKDYNAVFWFCVFTGISLYIILFFCAPLIAYFYNIPALTPLARFTFLGFLIGCMGTAHNAILTKKMMIKEKAKCTLIALFMSGTTGVIMAINGMSYWGIVTQNITYMFVSVLLIWHYSPWKPTFEISFKPLKKMFSFSIKVLITNIFVQVNANIFSVLLGRFYTPAQVGYYTQGNKWMSMGNNFIGTMVNSVTQPVLAEVMEETDRQRKVFRKMLRFISFVSFPVMFGLALIAPEFILITVTAKWLPSVPILQLLCIWGAVTPLHNLYSNMVVSRGKSGVFMWNIISLGIAQFLILFFTASFGMYKMITGFIIINMCWLFIWQYFALVYIRLTLANALKDILPYAFFAALTIFITYLLTLNFTNIYIVLFTKILFAITFYSLFMWISDSVIFKESISFLFKKKRKP